MQEGIVSPNDLDLVMSDGLGMRYAFIGPLETMHLNAEGMPATETGLCGVEYFSKLSYLPACAISFSTVW